jgi:hypothetical protein
VVVILFGFPHILLQSVLLYIIQCQTDSITLEDEHILRAFENSVLKRVLGTERGKKPTGG